MQGGRESVFFLPGLGDIPDGVFNHLGGDVFIWNQRKRIRRLPMRELFQPLRTEFETDTSPLLVHGMDRYFHLKIVGKIAPGTDIQLGILAGIKAIPKAVRAFDGFRWLGEAR